MPAVDFATNKLCAEYYSGRAPLWLRSGDISKFYARLASHDTVTVGLDYYALTGISAGYIPQSLLRREAGRLLAGKVLIYRVYLHGNQARWQELIANKLIY